MSMAVSGAGAKPGAMAMSGASARMPPQQKMASLFDKIDTSGSGSITQAQFGQAFQTMNPPAGVKAQGAEAVWSQLDPTGSGSVSKADFVANMQSVLAAARNGGGDASSSNTLAAATRSLDALGTGNSGATTTGINILV